MGACVRVCVREGGGGVHACVCVRGVGAGVRVCTGVGACVRACVYGGGVLAYIYIYMGGCVGVACVCW